MRRALLALAFVAGCTVEAPVPVDRDSVLLMGDGLLAGPLEQALAAKGPSVTGAAREGARMTHPSPLARRRGRDVTEQYRRGAYGTVVLTGGAEDLRRECRCSRCDDTLDSIVGLTGRGGVLHDLVTRLTQGGARVLLVGYPPVGNGDACRDEIRELNNRFSRMADIRIGVDYVSAASALPEDRRADTSGGALPPVRAEALATLIVDALAQEADAQSGPSQIDSLQ